ncbi:MAG: Ig-like domain-containing protein [Gammaproteobacteria bacterium]|nr:Ig-like domain-containing protein [Gammaproteobacteria bacterium]
MITRFTTLSSRLAVMLAVLFTVAACGGGGSGGFIPDDSAEDKYFVSVVLLDLLGEPTNTVTATKPARLEVTVTKKNRNGAPIPDVVVQASSDIATISPESNTGLTDENGVATFRVESGGSIGAGTITATVQNAPAGTEAGSINIQVVKADLRIGYFEGSDFIDGVLEIQPEGELSPGGTASLTFAVVNEFDNLAETQERVLLTSDCLAKGLASVPENPATVIGQTSINYTAKGCEGDDVITATLIDTPSQASGTVSVAPLSSTAGKITFAQADPAVIVIKGTGDGQQRKEKTTVTFLVTDTADTPIPGVDVSFRLSTVAGGLALSNATATSNNSGLVSTEVTAGSVPTTFFVFATIDAKGISTTTDVLAVSTGVADQRGISLTVTGGGNVIENGFNVDDVEREITVRMRDKFGSPILSGTIAVFDAEYGRIDPSCSLGISNGARLEGAPPTGECKVLWTSDEPRMPSDSSLVKTISTKSCASYTGGRGPCPDDLGAARGGRATISVSADGEEWFDDANGNNRYDEGETFENLPESFTDHNEDGVYTPVIGAKCDNPPTSTDDCNGAGADEPYNDRNGDGRYNTNSSPAQYNGLLCPAEGDGVFCSTELVDVRTEVILILSDAFSWDSALVNTRTKKKETNTIWGDDFVVYISDQYNNPPPAGSTVRIEPQGDCTLQSPTSVSVPNKTSPGAIAVDVQTDGEGVDGGVRVTLSASDGSTYETTYGCVVRDPNEPDRRAP